MSGQGSARSGAYGALPTSAGVGARAPEKASVTARREAAEEGVVGESMGLPRRRSRQPAQVALGLGTVLFACLSVGRHLGSGPGGSRHLIV